MTLEILQQTIDAATEASPPHAAVGFIFPFAKCGLTEEIQAVDLLGVLES